jgi:hypothetical protein
MMVDEQLTIRSTLLAGGGRVAVIQSDTGARYRAGALFWPEDRQIAPQR